MSLSRPQLPRHLRGSVTMPFQQTFWSAGFGGVVDRFGTPWLVNTEAAQ